MRLSALRSALRPVAPWTLAALALLAAAATYAALTRTPPLGDDPHTVLWVLNLDLVVLLALGILIARRVMAVRAGTRRGRAGAGLQARLVYSFSLLVAVPVVLMTVFSALFFHFGVQSWLSGRVETAITGSRAVAQAYLDEHRNTIALDTLPMARDLSRESAVMVTDPQGFSGYVTKQAGLRGLDEAFVLDASGAVLASAQPGASATLDPIWMAEADARGGEVVLLPTEGEDRVRAVAALDAYVDAYLLVGRAVDRDVLAHVEATRAAVDDYAELQASYAGLRLTVTLIYVLVGLLLLMAAVWFGLLFARRLGGPIAEMIAAADRVGAGDLSVRVAGAGKIAELGHLATAFNRMTAQLARQRDELRAVNRQVDERRRFTEAVLAGVSSGVLGLDADGRVTTANAVAARLLGTEAGDLLGRAAAGALPPAAGLLARGGEKCEAVAWRGRHFLVHVAGAQGGGSVLTFDDITELEAAQRKAAWGDVARRVAHEIKNPLTPIRLSAERLGRRYAGQITDGAEIFTQCVETIVRHVEDIGRMVDEFSQFARMPAPRVEATDLAALVREVVALHAPGHPGVEITAEVPEDGAVTGTCDPAQIRQALANLIRNAAEALDGAEGGRVHVTLEARGGQAIIAVEDSGLGLPDAGEAGDLTQPYVTHKPGGTGLGLAIVRKIAQDHGGALTLGASQALGGARVALSLPLA